MMHFIQPRNRALSPLAMETRKLRILVIADPHYPIPPNLYGGTERIVNLLCQGLQKRGHTVHLMAGKGSQSYGGNLILHRAPTLQYSSRAYRKILFQFLSISAVREVDVVINFGRLDYLETLLRNSIPLVCCFENPVAQSQIDFVLKRRGKQKRTRFTGVSRAQVDGLSPPERVDVVHNGVDIARFQFSPQPANEPYLAFLGRLTKNKGVDVAIEVAKQSGLPLKIAGNIPNEPGASELFETVIKPQLGDGCEWIGSVNDEQKNKFIGGATALLFPIQWNEPFANVVVESLACGTPVIATTRASTPEVIKDGETGFLCNSVGEIVEAVKRVGTIDRYACRADAEARFSADAMVEQYLKVVQKVLEK
jgi:glycosyltransferase involved in cell wall biosynthesis